MNNLAAEMNKMASDKKKSKKRKGNRGNKRFIDAMPLNKLLKPKMIKKLEKEELVDQININFGKIIKEIQKFYQENGTKIFDDRSDVADVFVNKKFAKALKTVLKDREQVPEEFLFLIGDLQMNNAFEDEKKLLEQYLTIFSESNIDKIKKVAKTLGCKKLDALLLVLVSQTYSRMPNKYFRDRVYKFLENFYQAAAKADLDKKGVAKIIKLVFGKNTQRFILQAMLEKRSNYTNLNNEEKEVWEMVSEHILTYLEKMDKDDRKELLKSYAKQRNNNTHVKRRINLLDETEYKGISKTVERLIKLSTDKACFM